MYSSNNFYQVDHFEGMCCPKVRNFIWKLFEEPDSSTGARVSKIIEQTHIYTLPPGIGGCELSVPACIYPHADPLHCARVSGISDNREK